MTIPVNQVVCGDCLEVMRGWPDGCIDAIVTDPPYGLSDAKGSRDGLIDVMANIVLPDYAEAYSGLFGYAELPFPRGGIALLDWISRAVWIDPGVAVPKGAVDLKGQTKGRDEEVEHASEPAIGTADGVLACGGNTEAAQGGCDFILNLRADWHTAICDGLRSGLRQLGPGRFSVPVVIPVDSSLARLLRASLPCGPSFFADLVGALNNAPRGSGGAASIVAGGATEVRAVLAFDMAGGTVEILPAGRATEGDACFELVGSPLVGTCAPASSLAAKLEPRRFRLVGDSADGALTIHFHKQALRHLDSTRKGFMGQLWDGDVPSVELWRECYRVLKDGGRLLAFSGARTQHRMVCRIEDAGFVIEDCMMWLYGSGFPKHKSKLKPAYEPICVARKGSVSELNIDAGRIETADGARLATRLASDKGWSGGWDEAKEPINVGVSSPAGRWPANVCMDEAAALALDQQSGVSSSSDAVRNNSARPVTVAKGAEAAHTAKGHSDSGGASRFLYVAKADRAERDAGCSALSLKPGGQRSNTSGQHITRRDGGDPGPVHNNHPTVKPVELMRWLIRLVAQPGQVVLDPFFGSGTTGVAANREGIGWIGIELNPDYAEIARARTAQQGLFTGGGNEPGRGGLL